MTHDFSDLTPPHSVYGNAGVENGWRGVAIAAARWGAEQAAERLKGQWPTPITDRPPTEADGDEDGRVQFVGELGIWGEERWSYVASRGWWWHHTPRWQPPAPPPLKEQALKALGDWIEHNAGHRGKQTVTLNGLQVDLIRRALEADS